MNRFPKFWHRGGISALLAAASMFAPPAAAEPATRTAVTPAWTWTGFYAGLNAGWGRSAGSVNHVDHSTSLNPPVMAGVVPFTLDLNSNGLLGGGQLGYNWQNGALVFGFETDLQASGIGGSRTFVSAAAGGFSPADLTASGDLDWFGTLRARFGFTSTDRTIYYLTGGLAYGGVQDSASVCFILFGGACDGHYVGSLKKTKTGWTIGAGAEHAWQGSWSLKIEYLYIDLGSDSVRLTDPLSPGSFFDYRFKHRDHIVRLGINYKY